MGVLPECQEDLPLPLGHVSGEIVLLLIRQRVAGVALAVHRERPAGHLGVIAGYFLPKELLLAAFLTEVQELRCLHRG
jgi:hypothetical protein